MQELVGDTPLVVAGPAAFSLHPGASVGVTLAPRSEPCVFELPAVASHCIL